MLDPRLHRLAEVLVHYSLATKPGDRVLIQAPAAAAALIREVYRQVIRLGAYPTARITLDDLTELALREGNTNQLEYVSELDRYEVECVDAWLVISAEENTHALDGINPRGLAARHKARAPLMGRCIERITAGQLRWCHTIFPTNAYAQNAGMSLSEYEDFLFQAGLLNREDPVTAWRAVHESQQAIVDFLEDHNDVHIVAPGVNLTYKVGGRKWINGSGTYNFPDGEVFTGPIESSVNGAIRFTFPAVYKGVRVEDVSLRFQDGNVVDATASRGHEFLMCMLGTDEGAHKVGEVAFGLNSQVDRFTGNTLFDEKIDGTMHLALGKSHPHTGGRNVSAIHWDMVADLRDGQVYVDGQLCYDHGKFVGLSVDERTCVPAIPGHLIGPITTQEEALR